MSARGIIHISLVRDPLARPACCSGPVEPRIIPINRKRARDCLGVLPRGLRWPISLVPVHYVLAQPYAVEAVQLVLKPTETLFFRAEQEQVLLIRELAKACRDTPEMAGGSSVAPMWSKIPARCRLLGVWALSSVPVGEACVEWPPREPRSERSAYRIVAFG